MQLFMNKYQSFYTIIHFVIIVDFFQQFFGFFSTLQRFLHVLHQAVVVAHAVKCLGHSFLIADFFEDAICFFMKVQCRVVLIFIKESHSREITGLANSMDVIYCNGLLQRLV